MGPVAATLAHNLGYQTSCRRSGIRTTRLGLPLSIIVAVLGTTLIRMAWPLH